MSDQRDSRHGRRPHQQHQHQHQEQHQDQHQHQQQQQHFTSHHRPYNGMENQGRCDPRRHYDANIYREVEQLKEQLRSERQLKEIAQDKEKQAQRELDTLARNAPLDSIRFVKVAERVRKDLEKEKHPPRKADYEELLSAFMFGKEELDLEKAKRQVCEEQLGCLKAMYAKETSSCSQEQHQHELQAEKDKRRELEERLRNFSCAVSKLKEKYHEEKLSLTEKLRILQETSMKEIEDLKEMFSQQKKLAENLQGQLDQERRERSNVEQQLHQLQQQHSGYQDQSTAALQEGKETVKCLHEQLEQVSKTQAETRLEKEELGRQLVVANEQTQLLKGQYEELQKNSESSQDKLTSDLQQQRLKHDNIQATLEKVSIFNEELTLLCQTQTAQAQQQAADYERELQSKDQEKRLLLDQQEELKIRLSEQEKECKEMRIQLSLIHEHQPEPAPEPEEVPKKKPSLWRRVQHFLGLRKPQRWKNRPTSPPVAQNSTV